MTRQELSKCLIRDAKALEDMYALKYGKPYRGRVPGRCAFNATWSYYGHDCGHDYDTACWYVRFMYVLIYQRMWAMYHIFGVISKEDLDQRTEVMRKTTRELWHEYSPKAFADLGRLLNP